MCSLSTLCLSLCLSVCVCVYDTGHRVSTMERDEFHMNGSPPRLPRLSFLTPSIHFLSLPLFSLSTSLARFCRFSPPGPLWLCWNFWSISYPSFHSLCPLNLLFPSSFSFCFYLSAPLSLKIWTLLKVFFTFHLNMLLFIYSTSFLFCGKVDFNIGNQKYTTAGQSCIIPLWH